MYSPRKVKARINRIFRLGDFIEDQIIDALKTVGIEVSNAQESVGGFWGHADGHTDGRAWVNFVEMLFEAKSMSSANFKKCQKVGVKEFKQAYWFQIHGYMGKLGLTHCLWVYYNKDNSEMDYYIIEFDPAVLEQIEAREASIIISEGPNEYNKIGGPSWYECKFCDDKDVCHHGQAPVKTCRSCGHCTAEMGGKWLCNLFDEELDWDAQLRACDSYDVNNGV
jgi:hypothetical protein